jgi:small-conductance mechanosensitive channel
MNHVISPDELQALLGNLLKPTALIEAGVLFACLGTSWAVSRALRGASAQPGSIWFGRRVIDGVLFPTLALLLAFAARRALAGVVPLAVFRLAVPILVSLALIRLCARVLQAVFPQSQLMRAAERTISWLAWGAVVLWITGVLPLVLDELDDVTFKIGSAHVSVRNMIEGAFSASIVMVVVLWLSAAIEARLLKGATSDELSVRKIAANTTRAGLLFVGLLFALSAVGIDLTALSVLSGAVGVGLGFGLQKLAANYVSGYVILAERSLRIGDLVKVDNFEGRITDIKTRYTQIRSLSGRESIVPNEMLITQRIENASLADPNLMLSTVVQVAYGTDVEALEPQLVAVVAAVDRVLTEPAPGVYLTAFAADGLELTVVFWILAVEGGHTGVRSDVNLAILRKLTELDIDIPFPQRVVHQPK